VPSLVLEIAGVGGEHILDDSPIEEVMGWGLGLVGLHLQSTHLGELFTVSITWTPPGSARPQVPKYQKTENTRFNDCYPV
jgi:hypothetical protein